MNQSIREPFSKQYLIELRNINLFEKSEYIDRPVLCKVKDNRLYYNKSNYFNNVSDEIFNFKISSYQVLKTLITGSSKHPKTSISSDERDHVETVVSVIRYTIDMMKEIEFVEE